MEPKNTKLKPKNKRPKRLPYQGWTPMKGVSQSLLQKFIVDKDRFHKKAVLGLKETDRKEAMEFGTLFHKLIELGARMNHKYSRVQLLKQMKAYTDRKYPSAESAFLAKVAITQYHQYREWESKREKYIYIDQEPVFEELITLPPINFQPNEDIRIRIPSGIKIPMRGRIDEVIEKNGMWIQENKTKSRINLSLIQDTLHANIQVMFYAVCAELKYGRPCKGVIYNLIRKPGLRQRQKEKDSDFLKRIEEDISAQPEHYFQRITHEFTPNAVNRWKREELLPLLYQIYIWWRSIEANPNQPWVDVSGVLNPFHGRKPFGVYDGMVDGKGDYYDLIVNNRKQGLTVDFEMFTELLSDDD